MLRLDPTKPTADKRYIRLIPKGTFAAKDVVGLDVSQSGDLRFCSAVKSVGVATLGDPWVAGVALEAGSSGAGPAVVQVYGEVTAVPTSTVAAKDPLIGITAGKLDKLVASGTAPCVGIALGADSGGVATVWLRDPLLLAAGS